MMDTIFRQYDIRGKVGSELIIEEVFNLVISIGNYLLSQNPQLKKVVVGMDGRLHSPAMKEQMIQALLAMGFEVTFIGTCPTPVLYFCMHARPFDAGLMITASHNTKEYNGIKICLGKRSVAGSEIQEIKHMYHELISQHNQADEQKYSGKPGTYQEYDAITAYISWMKDHFKDLQGYDETLVMDCAHGAAACVIPQLIKTLDFKRTQLLYATLDGNFPAHEADPVDEKNVPDLRAAVKKYDAQLGIGFDGDADRMAPLTHDGQLVLGDKLLSLFACDVLENHPGRAVVFDVKCSSALAQVITQCGGIPCISATGHSIIKQCMKDKRALLAGELSCHFFFADKYFGYDDGIYAALRLLSLLQKSGKTLHESLAYFPQKYATPEIRIECPQEKLHIIVAAVKTSFEHQKDTGLLCIDGVRVNRSYGWGLIRASNTQPVISLRFEADSQQALTTIKQEFKAVLKHYINEQTLQKALNV